MLPANVSYTIERACISLTNLKSINIITITKGRYFSFPSLLNWRFLLISFLEVFCVSTAFATLSLSSSLRDQKYTDKAVLKTENNYLAYSHAQKQLKEIDQAIISHKDLSSLNNIEISLKDNNTYISFKENIDQYQDLDVEIQLTQNQDRYKIIKWQEVTSKEWKNESTLPLLGSE